MLKQITKLLDERKKRKQQEKLEHLRELMSPPKPRPKPAKKSIARR